MAAPVDPDDPVPSVLALGDTTDVGLGVEVEADDEEAACIGFDVEGGTDVEVILGVNFEIELEEAGSGVSVET